MLLSMTGYGNSNGHFKGKEIIIEMRCLNSKVNDFKLKLPNSYRQKELEIRKILNEEVVRGKLDISIYVQSSTDADAEFVFNKTLFLSFYNQLKSLEKDVDLGHSDILNAVLKFPNVIETQEVVTTDEEFEFTSELLHEAIEKLNDFRSLEGNIIMNDMALRIKLILDALEKTQSHDQERLVNLKDRMWKSLMNNLNGDNNIDRNRFEQEVLFYLEKLDITEEKIRLKQHCDYFLQELDSKETAKSKKLNFISQEIGREINTLGAKAQYSPIQKLVVLMKDELEKIKEQLNNVL